jgi:putative PEP-CTERM system histidine kinase
MFCLLIVLALLQGRVSGVGVALLGASALTAMWSAALAIPLPMTGSIGNLLDSLRLSAWLILMVGLVGPRSTAQIHTSSLPFRLGIGFSIILVAYEVIALIKYGTSPPELARLRDFFRIGCGIAGLLAVENLWRNADDARHRDIWPFCLAMAAVFGFELFLYADRLMLPEAGLNMVVAAGRGLVGAIAVPLLALAMARNRTWQVNIHVSRTVVLHTLTLMASGIFFLVLAAVGTLVRSLDGHWGPVLQLFTLLGSIAVLVPIFGSHSTRIELKRLVARHFFSHRFDYRAEWLRFVETVSRPSEMKQDLPRRIVKALAQIVDSPSGTLWRRDIPHGFVCEVGWNTPSEAGRRIPIISLFIDGFRDGSWIQNRAEVSKDDWPFDCDRAWLTVPLSHGEGGMIGFVVLAPPLGVSPVDWETYDLLRAAGRQAASYLAEERSTKELIDTRLLNEYSKKFAFVMHDLKNMASQLKLVVANAHSHMDNEEFRSDMLLTLESSLAKLNGLLEQLRGGDVPVAATVIEPDPLIKDLVGNLAKLGTRVETRLAARRCRIAIDGERFRSILSHLINNAHEAAQGRSVIVASRSMSGNIVIEVADDGPGMDEAFIRDELFRPFRSTKKGGFGIGAFQTRELLRASGGELDVISKKGAGTTMRMTLPLEGVVRREAEIE